MQLTEREVAEALPRILEWVHDSPTLQEWYEQAGIDRDALYKIADSIAPFMGDEMTAFVFGAVVAWEIARVQQRDRG